MVFSVLAIVLTSLLTILSGTTLLFQGWGWWVTQRFWRRSPSAVAPSSEFCPPVSILIPVRGVDAGALANWTSFCQQDYPDYEVLFGVMDPQDPAVPVLQQVVAQFPHRAQLLVDLPPRGINHKISNLSYLLDVAQGETIVLADSDIRVSPSYLGTITAPFADPQLGMVTCSYVDHHPRYLGAALAALGRSLDFIPSVLIAKALDGKLKFALGPTIAMRRSILRQLGELDCVMNSIGIDFHLGRLTAELGYRVQLSTYILENDCGQESPYQVFQRELRWFRTIRWTRGTDYYGLLFTHGTVYSLLLLLVTGFQPWAIGVWATAWSVRFLQGFCLLSALKLPHLKRWLWLLPLRDAMSFWVWLRGCYGREIFWRGRWLKVSGKGMLQEKEF